MTGGGFDPITIVDAFNGRHVDYVLIGGFAAELHRAAVPPTRDIDFTPSTTEDNMVRLSAALDDLEARIRTAGVPDGLPFAHDAGSLVRGEMWNLTCSSGDFDLSLHPSGTEGYDDLIRGAIRLHVSSGEVPVASLADIIRSKEAAGRPKDFSALPALHDRLHTEFGQSRDEQILAMSDRLDERRNALHSENDELQGE